MTSLINWLRTLRVDGGGWVAVALRCVSAAAVRLDDVHARYTASN